MNTTTTGFLHGSEMKGVTSMWCPHSLKTAPCLPWKSAETPDAALSRGQVGSLTGFLFRSGKCAGAEQSQRERAFPGPSAISHAAAAAHG